MLARYIPSAPAFLFIHIIAVSIVSILGSTGVTSTFIIDYPFPDPNKTSLSFFRAGSRNLYDDVSHAKFTIIISST